MNEKILPLINKGERGLKSAKRMIEEGDYDFSTSRTYYAMFYLVEAVLLIKNLAPSSHRGTATLFYEHFIQPGIFEKYLHQDLCRAFDVRQQGDYWENITFSKEEAEGVLKKAEHFVDQLKKYLKKHLESQSPV